jgi:hypothetical protein
MPIGGDFARSLGSMQAARASTLAGGLRDINLQNAQQALQNRFNAANMFAGLGGQNANMASGAYGREGQGLDQRIRAGIAGKSFGLSGFLNQLGSGLGKGLGGGLSAMGTAGLGGIGNMVGGSLSNLFGGGGYQGLSNGLSGGLPTLAF